MTRAGKHRETPLVRRWKVALSNAGLKQAEWARLFDWTESHVSQVVAGKRESTHVIDRVTVFINEQEQLIAKRARKTTPNAA